MEADFKIEAYREKLADVVYTARHAKRLSQKTLAKLADVNTRTIVNIETLNYKGLTITTVQAVCKALDITVRMSLTGGPV